MGNPIVLDRVDEGPVDLQLVEREFAQIGEAGIAGSEVVERDPHAERSQPMQHGYDRLGIVDKKALGDLQFEPVRRKAGTGERVFHIRHDRAVPELVGRDIDRHGQMIAP